MHSVKRYRFWEEPLELDEHLPEDSCLVPANQITLREFNEPPADYIFDDEVCCFLQNAMNNFHFQISFV